MPARYLEEFFDVLLNAYWQVDLTYEYNLGSGIRLTTRKINRIRSPALRCLGVHIDTMDFSVHPPTTSTETAMIPAYHAEHIGWHNEMLLSMTERTVKIPDESPLITYFGLTSWGRLAPRDYYLTRQSIEENEPETRLTDHSGSIELSEEEGDSEEESN